MTITVRRLDYKPKHSIKYTSLLYNCTASLDSYNIIDQEDLARLFTTNTKYILNIQFSHINKITQGYKTG